jgi:hypothetical protein
MKGIQDITECGDNELSLIVFNDESLYRIRRQRAYLEAVLRELFDFTYEQLQTLNNDLDEEEGR